MAQGDYRLTLTAPDGETVVFERDIRPEHVEAVAGFLRDNYDLVRRGVATARAVRELRATVSAIRAAFAEFDEAPPPRRRIHRKAPR